MDGRASVIAIRIFYFCGPLSLCCVAWKEIDRAILNLYAYVQITVRAEIAPR